MLTYQISTYVDVISTFYIYWNIGLLEDIIYSIMIFVLHEIARRVLGSIVENRQGIQSRQQNFTNR